MNFSENPSEDEWRPRCDEWPSVVRPVRIDPTGKTGPTRAQARHRRWRMAVPGYYVPASTDTTVVEQRILESTMRWHDAGVVTGWASLRLHRGGFFDGIEADDQTLAPVPVVRRGSTRPPAGTDLVRSPLAEGEVTNVHGIACTIPERAIVDEILRLGELRAGVAVIDMACAGELTSLRRLRAYVVSLTARRGLALVDECLAHAVESSRSPRETLLRLIWVLDARMQTPLCNHPVWSVGGDLLGVPDLFDADLGVAGEYDGAHHRSRARHRADVSRAERFTDHGIETFTMVAGDTVETVTRRMLAACDRATSRLGEARKWSLTPQSHSHLPGLWGVDLEARLEIRELSREAWDERGPEV